MRLPIHLNRDPDIGMCDLCGTEDGHRYQTLKAATFDGERCLMPTWLCISCRRQAIAERRQIEAAR